MAPSPRLSGGRSACGASDQGNTAPFFLFAPFFGNWHSSCSKEEWSSFRLPIFRLLFERLFPTAQCRKPFSHIIIRIGTDRAPMPPVGPNTTYATSLRYTPEL